MGLFGYSRKDWRRETDALCAELADLLEAVTPRHPQLAQELAVALALLSEQADAFPRGVKRTQAREIDGGLRQILQEIRALVHAGSEVAPLCYAVLLLNTLRAVRALGTESRPPYAVQAELDFAKAVCALEGELAKHGALRAKLRALGSNEDLDVKALQDHRARAEEELSHLRRTYAEWRACLAAEEHKLATLSPALLLTLQQVCAPVMQREL